MKKLITIAIIAGALCGTRAYAQTQATGNRTAVPWSDPSRPGLVKVTSVSGAIAVRTHTGRDVIIEGTGGSARNRTPDRNTEGLTLISGSGSGFTVEEANNVITISTNPNWRSAGGSIDIQVPVKTNLQLHTISNGSISVDGVEGDLEVSNINGAIRFVNVAGSVVASTRNGSVSATVREVAPNKPTSFVSSNGRIEVTLAPATRANLKIRTDNGDVWSDFDIQRTAANPPVIDNSRPGRGGRLSFDNTINGTINGGGTDIELRTFNGSIYLRKGK